MILGLGIDIVNISRIQNSLEKFGNVFEERVFTKSEIKISHKFKNIKLKSNYFAKRFAAKEAFAKATGLGIGRGFNFTDIEISNDQNGKPIITLLPNIHDFLRKHFQNLELQIDLSMSDEKEIAQAIVIISKKHLI